VLRAPLLCESHSRMTEPSSCRSPLCGTCGIRSNWHTSMLCVIIKGNEIKNNVMTMCMKGRRSLRLLLFDSLSIMKSAFLAQCGDSEEQYV
jgi:hypothetical protein